MTAIGVLAQRHGLLVVEDAAQAIGAEFKGRRAGSLGHVGCFSFYPTKNLGGIGDGGMLTTDDQSLADRLRLLRGHGMQPRYYHQTVGINSRLDTLQAAVLNVKLPHLDRWSAQRRPMPSVTANCSPRPGWLAWSACRTLPPSGGTSGTNMSYGSPEDGATRCAST